MGRRSSGAIQRIEPCVEESSVKDFAVEFSIEAKLARPKSAKHARQELLIRTFPCLMAQKVIS